MSDCVRVSGCRLCEGSIDLILAFTPTPPGDQYARTAQPQSYYPLDLMECRDCGAVQLADTVDPALIYPDYIYTTSISPGLSAHFENYAESTLDRVRPTVGGYVLDIGSNDGTLLRAFKGRGWQVLGVDPATAIASAATAQGIPTEAGFFTEAFAQGVVARHGPARLITANHIMANVADLHDFIEGVKTLLAKDGTFVFETGYWPAIMLGHLIDTIEHEHIHYFAVTPLQRFFARHGLTLVAVEEQPTKGGSLRGFVQWADAPALDASVSHLLAWERGVLTPERRSTWVSGLDQLRADIHALVSAKPGHERWVGYGAAVGSTLLLHYFGLGDVLTELWDDNARRHGWYSPGYHLPVCPPNASAPDKIVMLAWRYADRIRAHHPEHAGKWIQPLPALSVAWLD